MFKSVRNILLFSFACCSPDIVIAQSPSAKIFGAMPAVLDISLSPDGNKIAFLSPGLDREIDLYTLDLRAGDKPQRITTSRGDPENLFWCAWVSNERLACKTGAIQDYAGQLYSYTNLFAVNADGSKPQLLTKKQGQNAIGYSLGSGSIIDWMPGDSNLVMMSRSSWRQENGRRVWQYQIQGWLRKLYNAHDRGRKNRRIACARSRGVYYRRKRCCPYQGNANQDWGNRTG
ncbi:MAG: hypothetical protein U5J78_08035 [Parasphingorhabdus sp.]|nr:hypothetical protein [Parasphingorhabdus sp.]